MKSFAVLMALVATLCMAGIAQAKDPAAKKEKKEAKAEMVQGTVSSVDANGNVKVTPKTKKGEAPATDLSVATDASTVVTIDGKPGKVADLTPGMHVKVTPKTGTATKIDATSKAAGKAKKKKKDQ